MTKKDLTSSYAGLKIANPIVIASSGYTNSVSSIARLAEAGAGAVVLKSLFEEQIEGLTDNLIKEQSHVEAYDYIRQYVRGDELGKHLDFVSAAKKEVDIPIIASINCFKSGAWVDFATQMADAGADAIEVNIMRLETDLNADPTTIIRDYIAIAKDIAKTVKVPVSVKLPKYFSALVSIADKLSLSGVKGVTLFNRSFQMNVDLERECINSGNIFTSSADLSDTLRYVGLVASRVPNLDISASTGIHNASDALKVLLVGASSVQLCSTLYINGVDKVTEILEGINSWMTKKQYQSIAEFRGRLKAEEGDATHYSRMQFMKYFSNR